MLDWNHSRTQPSNTNGRFSPLESRLHQVRKYRRSLHRVALYFWHSISIFLLDCSFSPSSKNTLAAVLFVEALDHSNIGCTDKALLLHFYAGSKRVSTRGISALHVIGEARRQYRMTSLDFQTLPRNKSEKNFRCCQCFFSLLYYAHDVFNQQY